MPKHKKPKPIVAPPKAAEYKREATKTSKDRISHQSSVGKPFRQETNRDRTKAGGGRGKRQRENSSAALEVRHVKRFKQSVGSSQGRGSGSRASCSHSGQWSPISVVQKQAAFAVQRLLEADSSRKHGASLKSLTLAPHIVAKKATYAVTCQVLKFSRLLEQLDEKVQLSYSQTKGTGADSSEEERPRPKVSRRHKPHGASAIAKAKDRTNGKGKGGPKSAGKMQPLLAMRLRLSKYVAMVLMYELLRGEGLARKGPAERAVLAAEPRLRAALDAMLRAEGAQSLDDLLAKQQGSDANGHQGPAVPHPRWVRVNTLKANVEDVVQQLESYLPDKTPTANPNHHQPSPHISSGPTKPKTTHSPAHGDKQPTSSRVVRDALLPDLLALPPGTDLHDHPLVARGSVVLQSKASCMPAHALAPVPGWTVVDCCAAPGNKTTHLAALMGNKGRVLAFDKDPRRLTRLRANAALTGASCITARLADFLSIDPTAPEFAEVRGVLLDPSCSGSGTTFTRMDHLIPPRRNTTTTTANTTTTATRRNDVTDEDDDTVGADDGDGDEAGGEESARVAQLARFQSTALHHALRFPGLQRLVYSTCSVHEEENEGVVAGALEAAEAAGMELVDPFPSWPRRGLPVFPGAEKLVRTDAHQDGTDGFFVAVFQKRGLRADGCDGAHQDDNDLAGGGGGAGAGKRKGRKQEHGAAAHGRDGQEEGIFSGEVEGGANGGRGKGGDEGAQEHGKQQSEAREKEKSQEVSQMIWFGMEAMAET